MVIVARKENHVAKKVTVVHICDHHLWSSILLDFKFYRRMLAEVGVLYNSTITCASQGATLLS